MTSLPAVLRSPMTWLVVLIVIAGVVVFTGSDDESSGDETGPVEVVGDPLVAYSEPDTGAGLTIPTVEATTLDGEPIELGPDGTGRLIAFFAHWCPHCQAEVPVILDWLERTDLPAGVEMVAVSTAVESSAENYPPSDWFAREEWPTPVIRDDEAGTLARAYGLTRCPYFVAVAGDGTVVARVTGELTGSQLDVLAELVAGAGVEP